LADEFSRIFAGIALQSYNTLPKRKSKKRSVLSILSSRQQKKIIDDSVEELLIME